MKKAILPAIAVIGLMAMSFTSATEAEIKVVKAEYGKNITNLNLKSLEDLQDFQKHDFIKKTTAHIGLTSIKGKNQTVATGTGATAFPGKIHHAFIVEGIESKEDIKKLNAIIIRYK